MSSLGFQTIYGRLNRLRDVAAERAFAPDDQNQERQLVTYESGRPVSDFAVVAFSVAYELDLPAMLTCLDRSGVPLLATERTARHPWVIAGGPLTFSNPAPLAPFVDVVVMGEAEGLLEPLADALWSGGSRSEVLRALAERHGFYVPAIHGADMPALARCDDRELPAASVIWTAEAALSSMFLVEAERGCSRGCSFCVMRRSTNGGMRVVQPERILAAIAEDAPRVGLVGAAVSDHPQLTSIVRAIVESGREIGLSSVRADRLTPELMELLVRGGYRTLTVAADGASERLRAAIDKKITEPHLFAAAELAKAHGMQALKVYVMLGLPDETEADIDELVAMTREQATRAGPRTRVLLGVSPFVPKRNTPLASAPFAGTRVIEQRLARLRQGLGARVEVRPTSARWAWVEYKLARGGPEAGLALLRAWQAGGSVAAWKKAFA